MGQNSEDILDGSTCAICGVYFKSVKKDKRTHEHYIYSHGYPVACKDCWDSKCGYPRANVDTF